MTSLSLLSVRRINAVGVYCVRLYVISSVMLCGDVEWPVMTWHDATESGRPVAVVRWCRSRPSVFFVLDSDSCLYIWDLNMDESSALKRERISQQSRSHESSALKRERISQQSRSRWSSFFHFVSYLLNVLISGAVHFQCHNELAISIVVSSPPSL